MKNKQTFPLCAKTDVFLGSGTIDLPTPECLAASWFFIKGIAGNTSPGATLPFGKYSCCMYTTGYPTGYGNNRPNSSPWDMRHLPDELSGFHGLAHFCQSGTGAIGWYYNYALITPFLGDAPKKTGTSVLSEKATPGYYSVVSEGNILSETTVSEKSAYHRFTFPQKGGKLAVDFGNNGLAVLWPEQTEKDTNNQRNVTNSATVTILSDTEVAATVKLDGIVHYFHYVLSGAAITGLMKDGKPIDGKTYLLPEGEGGKNCVFGIFAQATGKIVGSRLSDSLRSAHIAEEDAHFAEGKFDEVCKKASESWETALSRIEIEGASARDEQLFYSNMYHTLVKPSSRPNDSPLWGERPFTVDLCTMWDIYKTQLPLLFTLYPNEIGSDIIDTFFLFCKKTGEFPHTLLLANEFGVESAQACLLAEHSICDAYWRHVPADYQGNVDTIMQSIHRPNFAGILQNELPHRLTHLQDVAEACGNVADMLDDMGQKDLADTLRPTEARWEEAIDPETGLMRHEGFDYYEGNYVNYSFRLVRHPERRVELAGGPEKYKSLLDNFFGFTNPMDMSGRFEGFNNESDMETPFAYHCIGAMDRIADITRAADTYIFTTGRGGIPGNNDSGALSSCYLWLMMGIFPVAGQNKMLIGFPKFSKVTLHLPNSKTFVIQKEGNGPYVTSATLNNQPLADLSFTAIAMMDGGTLLVHT